MSGEFDSAIAAKADTIMFVRIIGGDWIEAIAPIAIPAHIAIGAAAIGATNVSSTTVCPNQVHSRPTLPT